MPDTARAEVQMGHPSTSAVLLYRSDFHHVFDALHAAGYRIVGPTVSGTAITYDELRDEKDLPEGWTDEQSPGHYRLKRRNDRALFGYAVGPQAWKKFLHPALLTVWQANRNGGPVEFHRGSREVQPTAFLGVRSCDLAGIRTLDKVLTGGEYADGGYRARRNALFIVAVNCTHASESCFCGSMGTGPKAVSGFDLALTELLEGEDHKFLIEAGSERGEKILAGIPHRAADPGEIALGEEAIRKTAASIRREVSLSGLSDILRRNAESPRWTETAGRCLSCANCTLVCPTCFCSTVEDTVNLAGTHSERRRKWDSCFTGDFSYIHGGSIRSSVASRYRQWLTHKFSYWIDQFGSPGCVGCGRCITWCPVGIDITEELCALRDGDRTSSSTISSKEKHDGNS